MAADLLKGLRVEPGEKAKLGERDPGSTSGVKDRAAAAEIVAADLAELRDLQYRLWAEARRSVLLVLQGMDAAGKDGTIRHVFTGVNPQGCRVVAFKAPSLTEAAHDFLWRIHQAAPARGEIGIFNRSHYEDVVAAQVVGAIDGDVRKRRYDDINEFESMLADEGTTVIKVFLHISSDEQRDRLQARLDDPDKRWKFNPEDLKARRDWDTYQHLYESAISATSTKAAPWYVVPGNHKWARNAVVSRLLVETLRDMAPRIPEPAAGLDDMHIT
jgi:PPK2 family polyphosphate:nucleotide phosphotransferase